MKIDNFLFILFYTEEVFHNFMCDYDTLLSDFCKKLYKRFIHFNVDSEDAKKACDAIYLKLGKKCKLSVPLHIKIISYNEVYKIALLFYNENRSIENVIGYILSVVAEVILKQDLLPPSPTSFDDSDSLSLTQFDLC